MDVLGDRKGRVGCHNGIKETLKINLHSCDREHPGALAELKMNLGGVGRALLPAQCEWPCWNIRGVGVITAQARGFRVSGRVEVSSGTFCQDGAGIEAPGLSTGGQRGRIGQGGKLA